MNELEFFGGDFCFLEAGLRITHFTLHYVEREGKKTVVSIETKLNAGKFTGLIVIYKNQKNSWIDKDIFL